MQKIIPAILTANSLELQEYLKTLRGQTNWIHVDIMDGKFVQNTSVPLFELGEAAAAFSIEIHLMVENPEKYLEDCKSIGAKRVIIHAEVVNDMHAVLEKMKEYGFQKAVAVNPQTQISRIAPYIESIDSVLVMGVNPGFQAQSFVEGVLPKIAEIRKIREDMSIGVDGGVNKKTIRQIFEKGADYVNVGSAIFKDGDSVVALRSFEEMVK